MSESEEMYLVMIASEKENNENNPVAIPRLAEILNITSASVNQMVRKLEETKLVTYLPYKGVDLTLTGNQLANRILRHRRLWEVFLVGQLCFTMESAEPLACKMEHIFPEEAIERLAKYLKFPTVAPDGKRIPAPSDPTIMQGISLTSLSAGQKGIVVDMHIDRASLSFLREKGVSVGTSILLLAISETRDVLIELEDARHLQLAASIAKNIELELTGERILKN